MYTAKEREKLQKQLARVEKCKGDCKHCKRCKIEIAGMYYAFGCDIAPDFSPISNTMAGLRETLLETLRFELS